MRVQIPPLGDNDNTPWSVLVESLVKGLRQSNVTVLRSRPEDADPSIPLLMFNDLEVSLVPAEIPYMVWAHNLPTGPWPNWYMNSIRDAYANADLVFTATKYAETVLIQHGFDAKAVGFPVELAQEPSRDDGDPEWDIIIPGRIDPDRYTLPLVHALRPLGLRVLAVTAAPVPKRVREPLEGYGVTVMGEVSRKDYVGFLGRSSCALIGSLDDSFNVSAAEAVLCGLPLVAPDSGPFPEFLPEWSLYEPISFASIRTAVEKALATGATVSAHAAVKDLTSPVAIARRIKELL